jgi:NAD(P)-dependent dehydrogenase (short-subunit alcohol dehydrogenase family)
LAVPADVGDPGAVERIVNAARDRFGRLDGAFNNAGEGHMPAPLAKLAAEDFDRALRVNARGVFLCMKHEIPAMIDAGGGAIVNMSSTAGLAGVGGMSGYVAAKHAVIGLTKSAALDYAADGVRVNAVAPGPISSDRIAQLPDEARAQIARAVPLGHIGKPEDVAAAVTWLLSDEAAFITGATLTVDGGRLSGI